MTRYLVRVLPAGLITLAIGISGCGSLVSPAAGLVRSQFGAARNSKPAARSLKARRTELSSDVFRVLLARSRDLGLVPPHYPVSLLLLLHDPSAAREAASIAAMYDPHSVHFGHFATLAELRRNGPRRADAALVRSSLDRFGLTTSWSPGDAWLSVGGPAASMTRAFGVRVHFYRSLDGQRFAASALDPIVPHALRGVIAGASHLESYAGSRPRDVPVGGLTPADLLSAYDIKPLRNQGLDGSGQTVVFFEIDGFRQSDLNAFTQRYHLPAMHPIIKAGPALSPGGEAPMDLEAVHAVAPGARLVVYNLDQQSLNNHVSSNTQFLDALVGFQRKIVDGSRGDIVSNSVGNCAGVMGRAGATAFKQVYDRADALGEAWFAASGDQGAYDCLQAVTQAGDPPSRAAIGVDLPASAPGVTGVGGTRLSVRTDGGWYSEEAWQGPAETAGSGGGVSAYFSRPGWQRAPGVDSRAFDPRGMREVPDVSAIADPATSGVYAVDGQFTPEGGTSQAAPIWAGIMALIDQYLRRNGGHNLGFANPSLYTLARTAQPYPPFHDVTLGGNLVYPATSGYDMASGLGTPDVWNLARDLLAYQRGGKP